MVWGYFANNPPTQAVLNHFKSHFGFEFENLQWQYEKKVLSAIVEKTFDSLVGKISSLFSHHAYDIVLLSGRPTSLKPLSDLFLKKYYAITPNRLKSMNDYRVGRWYPQDKRHPFINGNGKFINPKSIVTTGALIGKLLKMED
ncbi:MAG: virulence factor SrfB [Haliscomenobacter sp.]|nr:virulence factor SrfB [Haliscomenobacter sp.]